MKGGEELQVDPHNTCILLYAIWQALSYSSMNSFNTTLICTDYLSSLHSITDIASDKPLIQRIMTDTEYSKAKLENNIHMNV